MSFSENLKYWRTKKGMTQRKIAEMLGCTVQSYAQYENGKRRPKIETIKRFADALGVPVSVLSDIEHETVQKDDLNIKKVSCEEYSMALRKAQREVYEITRMDIIHLCECGGSLAHPGIDIQVSWASIGAVPADKALIFAKAVERAAQIALEFPYNGYEIEY